MWRSILNSFLTNIQRFHGSSLFMNSMYLMLATVALAGFGFVFWALVARDYDASTVGLAATLISLSGLLSMLSLMGFDVTFVRFLPKSMRKSDQINSGILVVTVASIVLSIVCVTILPLLAKNLAFVFYDPLYFVGFVFFTMATALNTLTNAIFLAYKHARDIFIINIIFSFVKVLLPLVVANGSAMTVFTLAGIAQLVGALVSFVAIKHRFGHVFSLKVHLDIIHMVKKYSFSVYAASVLNLLPPTLLPLIVVQQLAPEYAAYYYMAFTIASVLYTISYAAMQSAFTEGSHNEESMKQHVQKALKLIGVLLTPAIAGVFVLGNFILGIFGKDYTTEANVLLQIFAVSGLSVAAYSALGTIFKVTKNLKGVVVMNVVYAVAILGISYVLLPRFGIVAIGWAWLAGNIAAALVGLFFVKFDRIKST